MSRTPQPGPRTPSRIDGVFTGTAPLDTDQETTNRATHLERPTPRAGRAPGRELRPGMEVHQYELVRELGRGGMGQVFLARDTRLARRVAIKFLLSGSPELRQRMLAEARATASCTHENIVVIHEVDEHDGLPYIVLEYLEGETLSRLMRGRTLHHGHAVDLILPVVRALERAHEFRIVHRDLKPSNVILTGAGVVKVVDFGIAKFVGEDGTVVDDIPVTIDEGPDTGTLTAHGSVMGSLPYMAPEQWTSTDVDHRCDLWAVGIILFEMLAGTHPLAPATREILHRAALDVDTPMPSLGDLRTGLPPELVAIVDRCLAKRKDRRFASARALLDALSALSSRRAARDLAIGECPYPGLTAFQEKDADRFFGRSAQVAQAVNWVRRRSLVAVVGPSGAGKSSFVRAGLLPALKRSGEPWESLVVRPGRDPMASLAELLLEISGRTSPTELSFHSDERDVLRARLCSEPGYFGAVLRARGRDLDRHVLLFVDQFEELYTMGDDRVAAFLDCLLGAADDPSSPVRVVLSMRADFLERVGESPSFFDAFTAGLMLLGPLDQRGLREALEQPAEMAGYRFESDEIPEEMLTVLASSAGALPLLQFTAARLWETRDAERRLFTRSSYVAMGRVAGALARHADEVLGALSAEAQRLTRQIFHRLITPERARQVVELQELRGLSPDPAEIDRLVDYLADSRLLVVQGSGGAQGTTVEIVHESLITAWPTLKRWLDESGEEAAFVAQLRAVAAQWDARGRPQGLLWRGESAEEARRFHRSAAHLPARERDYLAAVTTLATRSTRLRRGLVVATLCIMSAVLVAAAAALIAIRDAEQTAQHKASEAESEAQRARQAETTIREQLAVVKRAEEARVAAEQQRVAAEEQRQAAEKQAIQASAQVEMSRADLESAYAQVKRALSDARVATAQAEKAARAEADAKSRLQKLLDRERQRVRELQERRSKIVTDLK